MPTLSVRILRLAPLRKLEFLSVGSSSPSSGLIDREIEALTVLERPFSTLPLSEDSALVNFPSLAHSTIFVDSALVDLLVESYSISSSGPFADLDSGGGSLTWSSSTIC